MPRYVALLRAINVGGHTVKMNRLCALFEELRFTGVSSFIASGNIIFEAAARDAGALERRIARHLAQALGYDVAAFVRSMPELAAVAAYEPFPRAELDAPTSSLYVTFLAAAPPADVQRKILAYRTESNDYHFGGRELYWLRRDRLADAPLFGPLLERTLAMPGTTRNATTVRKLAAKYAAPAMSIRKPR